MGIGTEAEREGSLPTHPRLPTHVAPGNILAFDAGLLLNRQKGKA